MIVTILIQHLAVLLLLITRIRFTRLPPKLISPHLIYKSRNYSDDVDENDEDDDDADRDEDGNEGDD